MYPWDFLLIKNANEMLQISEGIVSPIELITVVTIALGLIWGVSKIPKVRTSLPIRLLLILIPGSLITGFIIVVVGNQHLLASIKYQNVYWNQKSNYTQNGFVFAFTANLKQNMIDKPAGYSLEAIEKIAAKYSADPEDTALDVPVEQPNILYVMSESFFDPTRLSNYSFSSDPLKFIHDEQNSTPSGYILTPEFGGNTVNVEFEALTGMSMYFLKDGSIPYQQKLVKMSSVPSIASILKERGYRTLAIHPFDETFYNRNSVYPILGFDQFISDDDMKNTERITSSAYISDLSAVKEAVSELQASTAPTFLHLVTMQNHLPVVNGRNGTSSITVTGPDSSEDAQLGAYTQDVKMSDEALAYLQEELRTIKNPTIVIFWGDHLPGLASAIYANSGWDENYRLEHETTLLILANYDIGKEALGTLSPVYLGPTVFKLANQPLPPYYKMLSEIQSLLPGLSKGVLLDSTGIVTSLTAAQQELLDDYLLVEYDILEGDNYSQDLLFY